MMTIDEAWELIKNGEVHMDVAIETIRNDAWIQGMNDASQICFNQPNDKNGGWCAGKIHKARSPHIHVSNGLNDGCKLCRKDLRDPIHERTL